MANSFGLLCLAVGVAIIASRCLSDAKAFGKFMAILAVSLLVGAGVKEIVNSIDDSTSEKTTVISNEMSVPTGNTTLFVSELVNANLDCPSKEITDRDSVEIEVEGLPTVLQITEYLDDS